MQNYTGHTTKDSICRGVRGGDSESKETASDLAVRLAIDFPPQMRKKSLPRTGLSHVGETWNVRRWRDSTR